MMSLALYGMCKAYCELSTVRTEFTEKNNNLPTCKRWNPTICIVTETHGTALVTLLKMHLALKA